MDVKALAEELLHVTSVGVRPTSSTTAFLIDLNDQTAVLKFSAPGRSVRAEAWAYRAAAAQGLRVPTVLAEQADPDVMAVELLPGFSLWSRNRRDVDNSWAWQRAGAELRALHEIRVPGFGQLWPHHGDVAGRSDAWCPFVRSAREVGIRRLVDAAALDPQAARRLESRYDEAAGVLHGWSDGRLLHGDLEGGHIFVQDESFQGIIDFDQAQVGDPHWDLARVTLWDGESALDSLLDGYGRDTIGPDDRDLHLPLYLLAFVIHHAVQLVDRGQLENARGHLAQTRYERLL